VSTSRYFQPESIEELEALVAAAHAARTKLRPVGSGLSPNGLGFAPGGMVNLGLCDKARAELVACAGAATRNTQPSLAR
jgi:L-galactono-1,4-lactone dehydrogenase